MLKQKQMIGINFVHVLKNALFPHEISPFPRKSVLCRHYNYNPTKKIHDTIADTTLLLEFPITVKNSTSNTGVANIKIELQSFLTLCSRWLHILEILFIQSINLT